MARYNNIVEEEEDNGSPTTPIEHSDDSDDNLPSPIALLAISTKRRRALEPVDEAVGAVRRSKRQRTAYMVWEQAE